MSLTTDYSTPPSRQTSKIYVLGGQDSSNSFLGDVWALDVRALAGSEQQLDQDHGGNAFSLVPAGGSSSKPTGSLLCLEGTRSAVEDALSSLQASPLAALYEHTSLSSQSCAQRGFASVASSSDECFSSLSLHYAPLTLQPYPGVPRTDRGNLYQFEGVVDGLLVGHDFDHGTCEEGRVPSDAQERHSTLSPSNYDNRKQQRHRCSQGLPAQVHAARLCPGSSSSNRRPRYLWLCRLSRPRRGPPLQRGPSRGRLYDLRHGCSPPEWFPCCDSTERCGTTRTVLGARLSRFASCSRSLLLVFFPFLS